ncbi:phosphotransferase [Nanoarchaeota archaeon]
MDDIVQRTIDRYERRRDAWSDSLLDDLRVLPAKQKGQSMQRLGTNLFNRLVRTPKIWNYSYSEADKIIRLRQKQAYSEPMNLKYRFKLAATYVLEGHLDMALLEASKALERRLKMQKPLIDRIADKVEEWAGPEEKDTQDVSKMPLDAAIMNIVCNVFNEEYEEATESLRDLIHAGKGNAELIFLLAELYEPLGEPILSTMQYGQSLETAIKKSELWIKNYTENRNVVYIIKGSPFFENRMFVKEYNDAKTMETEWNNSRLFRQYLGSQIHTPLTTFKGLKSAFKSAGNMTLQEAIWKSSHRYRQKLLKDAAQLLARIHVLGTKLHERGVPHDACESSYHIEDVLATDRNHFTQKLLDTIFSYSEEDPLLVIPAGAKDKILSEYAAIEDQLNCAERDFYKDHNPRNIIVDEWGNTSAIDFESGKLMPCQIDLVSLLEFGGSYATQKQNDNAIEAYLREKERLLKRDIDRDGFMQTYLYARVHRHIEMVGYRSRDFFQAGCDDKKKAEMGRRQYHQRSAIQALEDLARHVPDQKTVTSLKGMTEGMQQILDQDLEINGH